MSFQTHPKAERYGVSPKRPIEGDWKFIDYCPYADGYRWENPLGLRAVSSVHLLRTGLEFHITISDNGKRAAAWQAERVLKQFDAVDFIEDNHAPQKVIRSFWHVVTGKADPCPCETEQKPEIDGDYVWRKGDEK